MWIDRLERRRAACAVTQGVREDVGFEAMRYPFVLPPLPYAHDALEPYIDERTMYLHHGRHLDAYIDKLNAALSAHPQVQDWSLTQLLVRLNELPEPLRAEVRHNAGGVYNHCMYFEGLTPEQQPPNAALSDILSEQFGSVESFTAQLKAAAMSVFGSGYAWLCAGRDSALVLTTTKNQDNPLTDGLYPLIAVDVWEHAYYIKHYNRRDAYLNNYFSVLSYAAVVERVAKWARFDG